MKDEVLELLEPDVLARYKRMRPRLVAAEVVAVLFAAAGMALILFVGSCEVQLPSMLLLMAGSAIAIGRFLVEKSLTRSVSTFGVLFSTGPRMALELAWVVCSVAGYALYNAHYLALGEGSLGPVVYCG